jgi:NADH-quinone oxidoreductase subunit N
MLDLTDILMTIAPELWLAAAGLVGVLLGAVFGDRFNSLSFKFGALSLFVGLLLQLLAQFEFFLDALAFSSFGQEPP